MKQTNDLYLPLIRKWYDMTDAGIKHEDGKVSFTPSVGNYQIPCKSHYIITKSVANFV